MTDIMNELDAILKDKGVGLEESSATPTPEMITIPLRHLYVLYSWATAGHDVITGHLGKAIAAVMLTGIGTTGESKKEVFEAYGDMLHAFADRTEGFCDSNIDPKDSLDRAIDLVKDLEAVDRQMGKPIGYWKTI